MDEQGESCYPSTKSLAEETGLSERSVCTHLEQAERDGWVAKRVKGINGQGWKRHSYFPSIPPNALNVNQSDQSAPTYETSKKRRAQKLVSNAIAAGHLHRLPCEVCGTLETDAHHDDYDHPLNVRWLCRSHHRIVHKEDVLNDVQHVNALNEVQCDVKRTEPHAERTEPDDINALNDVQWSTSLSTSMSTPSISTPRARKNKPAPIHEDWKPDAKVYAWAQKHGLTTEAVDREIDEFVLYWKGRGESRPGWDSTFINRLKQVQRGPPPTSGNGRATKPPRAIHDDKFGERKYTGTPIDDIDWLNAGNT